MTLLPERWPPSLRRGIRNGLLIGAVGTAGVAALWVWSDRWIAAVYDHFRPGLEKQVGRVMGRPLRLGPYRGIGVDGLRIGPSRFLTGSADQSSAAVEEVQVWIDPLASLRQRLPILDLSFSGARVDLRRDARGRIWVLGAMPPGREPPRLDLHFRLIEPARVSLRGFGASPAPIELTTTGMVRLRTHLRSVDVRARAGLPGGEGSVQVAAGGNWQSQRWQADLRPLRLSLAPFSDLLPRRGGGGATSPAGRLAGFADGRLRLDLQRGVASCQGDLQLRGLRWRPAAPTATALTMERLPLRCRGRDLEAGPGRWRYGGWGGQLAGRLAADRRLAVRLRALPPAGSALGTRPIDADLRGRWQGGELQVAGLDGRWGRSTLTASGRVGTRLDLGGRWRVDAADLPVAGRWPDWLKAQPYAGTLRVDGRLAAPRLRAETGQPSQALIGPWRAAVAWSGGTLRLERLSSQHLQASAALPLAFRPGRGLTGGDLTARLSLRDYPASRLNRVVGTRLQGRLDAEGTVSGPLAALRPDLDLRVHRPGAGPLLLQETWRGTLRGEGPSAAPTGRLRLTAVAPAPTGRIDARLDRRWMPVRIDLDRQGGQLSLSGRPSGYRWRARSLPLQGLAVATGPGRPFEPLQGALSGSGALELQPLGFNGRVALAQPQFLGVGARSLEADVRYDERAYRIRGSAETIAAGRIRGEVTGRWKGPFEARLELRNVTSLLYHQFTVVAPRWSGRPQPRRGQASDLGTLAIDTFTGTIQDQLEALRQARERLEERDRTYPRSSRADRLARLQARVDADLIVKGPDLRRARVDLSARGHLWESRTDRDEALAGQPFTVRIEGPISQGQGRFTLSGLPLSLLALLTPVPGSLRGSLGATGSFRLGGARPGLTLDLSLADASLGRQGLSLERGRITLRDRGLAVDLALRAGGSVNSVDLAGFLPLDPTRQGLELRLASRGDGMRFLTDMTAQALEWKRGSADLQLLVRGSLLDPIANGFLRLRGGECRFIGQSISGIEATVLFDFQQLLVQELQARVGTRGRISGEGRLGLVRPLSSEQTLAIRFDKVPFSVPRVNAVSDGRIAFGGSLAAPVMGGDLAISNGSINVRPGQIARPATDGAPGSHKPARPVTMNELLEAKWDFRQPLVLLGPEVESPTGESLRQAVPRFPYLAFEGLRLRLGPDLRVVVPNVANFTTGGSLRIAGRLDPSLQVSGVVRLKGGRLNLFTTSFGLDPDAPNVAIFTPSLGLVPYLDVALRTRLSDSLNVIAPSGLGQPGTTSVNQIEPQSGFSSLNQLQLILVTVSVSGPADRLAENIKLRSSPPLPQERLVALIGGNSLAGLSGGQAGTALATVVGQSLLSPVLASLSEAFGQRVSFALYPTYVNQRTNTVRETFSRRVPPQLVLGSEIGFDLSDRFKASVLAAPNRSDVPPQLNLSYRASESFNLEGSVDSLGSWQSQLRLFFRF